MLVAGVRTLGGTVETFEVDGAQLERLSALLGSHRLSMPTPRSCNLDQIACALERVVAGHEPNGVAFSATAA